MTVNEIPLASSEVLQRDRHPEEQQRNAEEEQEGAIAIQACVRQHRSADAERERHAHAPGDACARMLEKHQHEAKRGHGYTGGRHPGGQRRRLAVTRDNDEEQREEVPRENQHPADHRQSETEDPRPSWRTLVVVA